MAQPINEIRVFSLKDLQEVDGGRIGIAIDQHIAEIADDLLDRPGDKRPRKLALKLEWTPNTSDDGYLIDSELKVEIDYKPLSRKARPITMNTTQRDGEACFTHSLMAPSQPDQPGLPFAQEQPAPTTEEDSDDYEDL